MLATCANPTVRHDPPMCLRDQEPVELVGGRWWLVHTKPRQEKALAWDLRRLEVDYFLPLIRRPRRWGHRTGEAVLPLFPGYLFVACRNEEERYQTLATNRAAQLIEVSDQTLLTAELAKVFRAVQSPHPVSLYAGIRSGRRCRITAGSLRGLEGVVQRVGQRGRVHLEVTLLGQSAVVEVDATLLEAC